MEHALRPRRCLRQPVGDLRERLRFGNAHADGQPGPLPDRLSHPLAEFRRIVRYPGEVKKAFVDGILFRRRRHLRQDLHHPVAHVRVELELPAERFRQ